MKPADSTRCTAFDGHRRIASGSPEKVALAVRTHLAQHRASTPLVLDDASGQALEFDLRGSADDVRARLRSVAPDAAPAPRGPGRPKLGVVAKEVTLLPRHWDWLSRQPGGASVTLRQLVEDARRAGGAREQARQAGEALDRAMRTLAGNLPGYEDASRAFWRGEKPAFERLTKPWPADVRNYVRRLAKLAWSTPASGD
ncbi:DUF2239 family protein [Dyella sp. KRB-257]|uniref:DUF2239 family protein n=1 Tax=Dyella sp. KRB-257 TaxID=3400915 RepID=UPI003C0B4888